MLISIFGFTNVWKWKLPKITILLIRIGWNGNGWIFIGWNYIGWNVEASWNFTEYFNFDKRFTYFLVVTQRFHAIFESEPRIPEVAVHLCSFGAFGPEVELPRLESLIQKLSWQVQSAQLVVHPTNVALTRGNVWVVRAPIHSFYLQCLEISRDQF